MKRKTKKKAPLGMRKLQRQLNSKSTQVVGLQRLVQELRCENTSTKTMLYELRASLKGIVPLKFFIQRPADTTRSPLEVRSTEHGRDGFTTVLK
jgi:hypothetical protein